MVLCYISMFVDIGLFPDAKMRKYGTQNFVGADFSNDFAKVAEGFAQVLGDQIGRKWL